MTKPKRIQRKRTKGWKMPPNTIYVGRPSKWGNPYSVSDKSDESEVTQAIADYLFDLSQFSSERLEEFIKPLRGKNLACWCKEGDPCHADVLLRIANQWPQEAQHAILGRCRSSGKGSLWYNISV